MVNDAARDVSDRRLFNEVAASYARKDRLPAQARARRLRLEQTVAQVPITRTTRVLEAGCGAGYAARYLEGRYAAYVGFDHSEEMIAVAERENGGPNRQFLVGNAKTIRLDTTFDLLLMIGVLHHIDEPRDALRNLLRHLRHGSWIAVNEPQRANPLIRTARALRKRLDDDYSDEQDQYLADELKALLIGVGVEEVRLIPQGILSTPFAEVAMPVQSLLDLASRAACSVDRFLERGIPAVLKAVSWNLIAVGRYVGQPRRSSSDAGKDDVRDLPGREGRRGGGVVCASST